jgi:hypothetical protein
MVIGLILLGALGMRLLLEVYGKMEDPFLWTFIFECAIEKFKLEKNEP